MKATGCAKRWVLLGLIATALVTCPCSLLATILYQANDVTWQGGGAIPSVTLSQPMTKTDTYYIQYTVELTSSVPPWTGPPQDPNNRNASYPNVALANATNGGASFLFYLGGGYNSDYLFTSGFSTSTWNSNQFAASDALPALTRVSTGLVAQYSTVEYGVVKYQVDITLNMGAGTYDYGVSKLNGSGTVLESVTLSGLQIDKGNYWNNNSSFSTLNFQSSTSQMTAHFDSIVVSTTPIPEPGTFVLAGLGISLVCVARRRRQG